MKNTTLTPAPLPKGEGIKTIQLIPLSQLSDSPSNPREKETPEQLQELMNSIKERGLMQAIIVRKLDGKERFEVVAGHRRFWAFQELKVKEISAVVLELDNEEVAEYQLIENLQRTDIHPLKEAEAYKHILSQDDRPYYHLAEKIGKSESYIVQRLQLLSLNKESRKLYLENVLTTPHALLLAKLIPDDQLKALDFLLDGNLSQKPENLIARDVKEFKPWIEMEIEMHLTQAPWDKNDAALIPGVAACLACPKNSGYNTALFPELNKKHVCNDRACFNAKMQAYFKQTRHASKKEEQRDFILLSDNYGMDTTSPMYVKGAVKMNGRYIELKDEKKTCEHTKKGQYIDGPKKGKFVLVCNYSKCSKHWKPVDGRQASRQDNYNSPANVAKREAAEKKLEQKISDEREFRYNVMTAMLEKCPKKLTLDLLRGILLASIESLRFSVYSLIARRHEWISPKIDYSRGDTEGDAKEFVIKQLQKLIRTEDESDLMKLYCEVEYSRLMDVNNQWDMNETELITQSEKLFNLDLKQIRNETEKQLKKSIVNGQPDASTSLSMTGKSKKKKSVTK